MTFSEDVINVGGADFEVDGPTGATLAAVAMTGSTSVYEVTASGGDLADLDGEVTLTIAGTNDIKDNANNDLSTAAPPNPNETYVLDNTAPTVTKIERQDPTNTRTNADTLTWRVTFSEDVINVDGADFEVDGPTGATLAAVAMTGSTSVYEVTASGGDLPSLDGEVTLTVAGTNDIKDNVDNDLSTAAPPDPNETYVLDNTAPTVTKIERQDPTNTRTNADTLTWRVTFSGDVINVDGADFEVDGPTGATLAATEVSASVYYVAASGGNLADLDGEVTLALAGTNDIKDNVDNDLSTAAPNPNETYVLDNTAPTVEKIERQTPATSPTNADTLTWLVTFSESVINVGGPDFTVDGPTGATLASTAMTGSTSVYEVTASGGDLADLDGEVTLALAGTNDIKDNADKDLSTAAPNPNETYVLDNTAPTVEKTERQTPTLSPTNADTLTWLVTFSDSVINVGGPDFTVDGPTGATLAAVAMTGSTSVYKVTVSGGDLPSLDGEVTLALAGTNDIKDNADNDLSTAAAPNPNETYVLDNTAPRVTSIERQDPTTQQTNADTLKWRVTFNEDMYLVNREDFRLFGRTESTATIDVSYSSGSYTVTASGGDLPDLDATVNLSFVDNHNIRDRAGNPLVDDRPIGTSHSNFVVDNTAPTVTITDVPTSSNGAFPATFTFNEPVTGFILDDITVGNGVASHFAGADGNRNYAAQITPTDDGEFTVDVEADVAADGAGNGNTAATRATSNYTPPVTDTTAPTVTKIERQTPATSPTNADTLTWRVTFSESVINVNGGDFEIAGTTASLVATAMTGSTSVYEVAASGGNLADLDGEVTLALAGTNDIKDNADNDLSTAAPNPNETYVLDNTAPTVEKIERQTPATSATNADSLTWRVTFNEGVMNVSDADFAVTGTTETLTYSAAPVSGSASQYDVTVGGAPLTDLDATLTLTFATGHDIQDLASNPLTAIVPTGTNHDYVVDNTAPTVTITTASSTSTAPFTATFTFDEAVTGFIVDDITVGNGEPSNLQNPSSDNRTFTATITPVSTGDVTLNVSADVAMDPAGNGNTAAAQLTISHTSPIADTTAPTVTSIVRQDPTTEVTNANSLTWRVTFNENVKDIDNADFVIGGTTASLNVVPRTGSTSVYDVTASGGDLADREGTVTLSFASGQNIKDNANNDLTNTTPTGTDDRTYEMDNTAPTVTKIERESPATSPTNADTLTWRVTFSEDVQNVNGTDFTVTGTTAGRVSTRVSSDVYQVSLSSNSLNNLGDLDGTVTLSFTTTGLNIHDITDLAGNDLVTTGRRSRTTTPTMWTTPPRR